MLNRERKRVKSGIRPDKARHHKYNRKGKQKSGNGAVKNGRQRIGYEQKSGKNPEKVHKHRLPGRNTCRRNRGQRFKAHPAAEQQSRAAKGYVKLGRLFGAAADKSACNGGNKQQSDAYQQQKEIFFGIRGFDKPALIYAEKLLIYSQNDADGCRRGKNGHNMLISNFQSKKHQLCFIEAYIIICTIIYYYTGY